MSEEQKEMSIRERIEWLLDKVQREDKDEKKMRTIYALITRVYVGERF